MTLVLGLGNVLMGDDGFGPAAVRAFEADYIVPPDVAVLDLGTPGLDLTPWLADADAVVIVDTVRSTRPPGTLTIYNKADVLRYPPSFRVHPHDPGVKETLLALEFAGREPRELTLIGVAPERTEMALTLSPRVAAAIPPAVNAIARALERYGISFTHRAHPRDPRPWWARSSDRHAI